ncbi:MAG: J domain-containing protein [Anaerolineae bacterium]|nr:MAG: J domain-containing protein [Anaerolineae bacterium]
MDYFTLLGVEVTATPEEIKQAYRRKAAERFHEIAEAYAVLIDENRRQKYLAERIQARTMEVRTATVRRRRPRTSLITMNVGLLIFALTILLVAADGFFNLTVFAVESNATSCRVVPWRAHPLSITNLTV